MSSGVTGIHLLLERQLARRLLRALHELPRQQVKRHPHKARAPFQIRWSSYALRDQRLLPLGQAPSSYPRRRFLSQTGRRTLCPSSAQDGKGKTLLSPMRSRARRPRSTNQNALVLDRLRSLHRWTPGSRNHTQCELVGRLLSMCSPTSGAMCGMAKL